MFSLKQPVEPKKLANISGYDTSSNQEAIPVTFFAGVAKIPLTWITPFYNLTSKAAKQEGKKGVGGGSSQKNWYADIAGVACVCPDDAPVDAVLYVLVNDEIAFTGPLSRSGAAHYAALTLETYCQAARVYWGTKDQPIDTLILGRRAVPPTPVEDPDFLSRDTSTWPRLDAHGEPIGDAPVPGVKNPLSGHYDLHPAYRNQCYFCFRQFFLGSSPNMPNVSVIIARGSKFFEGARFEADEAGINPIPFLYELLTDDLAGAGLPEVSLTAATFQDTATALTAAGILIAPVLRQVTSLRAFVADYLKYFDGFVRRRGSFLELGYFSHGNIDDSGLLTLDDGDLTEEPAIQPRTLDDTKNHVDVVFTNRGKWYGDDAASDKDLGNFNTVREKRLERIQAPFVIDPALAQRMATEAVRMLAAVGGGSGSSPFLFQSVRTLLVGDRFKLNSASFGLTMLMRLLTVEAPADRENVTKLSYLVEQADWRHLYLPPAAPKDPDFTISAFAIEQARIVDLPSQLRDVDALQVAVLALRPSAAILGFRTHLSTDAVTYDLVAEQRTFAVWAKIVDEAYPATGPILDTTVGMVVELYGEDLEQIQSLSDQQRDDVTGIWIFGNEFGAWGDITALGEGKFRIFSRRAIYGSVMAAHNIGDAGWFVFRNQITPIAHATFLPDATVDFKLQPFTATENIDIADVDPISHTFDDAPFGLAGLEVNKQGSDLEFTGRNPKFNWRIFSAGGAEITGPQLSLGAWDDRFGWFELRVRDADSGDVVWTGQTKINEYVFDFEQNALSTGGKRRRFFLGVSAVVKDGSAQTPWLENDEPFENPQEEAGDGHIDGVTHNGWFANYHGPFPLDHAGFLIWRSLDPDFVVDLEIDWVPNVDHDGVTLVYDGADTRIFIPQPEASTFYYKSARYDTFGKDGIEAQLAVTVEVATQTLTPTIPAPPISEGSRSFDTPFAIAALPFAGDEIRYSFAGDVSLSSPLFPSPFAGGLPISQTCILRWRGYIGADKTPTQQGMAVFTLVGSVAGGGGPGDPTCAMPSPNVVDGTWGRTSVEVELACGTTGAVVHYNKNGAGWLTYSSPITLALDIDSIEFYASATGYQDSPSDYFDNPSIGDL